MAVYEYRCEECEKDFTVHEPMAEHDDAKREHPVCPGCGSSRTVQLFEPFYPKTSVKS